VRLELLAQRVHEVADVAKALAPGAGPERLGDHVGRHHAVALADQVLEELPRALLEPLAAQRSLRRVDARAPERGDPKLRAAEPVRVTAPAAVARVTRAQVEDGGWPASDRGGGHPDRRDLPRPRRDVDSDLRQRALARDRAGGQAAVL